MADTTMTEARMRMRAQEVELKKASLLGQLDRMKQQIDAAKHSIEAGSAPMLPDMNALHENLKQWEMSRCRLEGYREAIEDN